MTSPYAVRLDRLEEQSRVRTAEQVALQAEPRLQPPLVAGPAVHPYGDGAIGPDGDGD